MTCYHCGCSAQQICASNSMITHLVLIQFERFYLKVPKDCVTFLYLFDGCTPWTKHHLFAVYLGQHWFRYNSYVGPPTQNGQAVYIRFVLVISIMITHK